jgi:hypothetical protein
MQRVLLVHQEDPMPIERLLQPSDIDWRITPELEIDMRAKAPHFKVGSMVPETTRKQIQDLLKLQDVYLDTRVVTITTNSEWPQRNDCT